MTRNKQTLSIIISFLFPSMVLAIVFFLRRGVYPFGESSVLTYDLYYQYAEFYALFRRILSEGHSLLYSWQMGMGGNLIPWLAYYLLSPFSVIVLLVPENLLTEAITLILLLKFSCCGGCMALYLRKVWNTGFLSTCLFALLYSGMGFLAGYFHMIMILDAVYLLPLILIQLEKGLRGKRWQFFAILLSLLFVVNFYAAFSTGIFIFLYSIYMQIREGTDWSRIRAFYVRFFLAVLLALGCSMFVLLPTFVFFKDNSVMLGQTGAGFGLNFNPLEFLAQLFWGMYTPADGYLPHVYSGLLPLILAPLFLLDKKIPARERAATFVLTLLLCVCMSGKFLNFLLHGFDNTNGYPFRYSWLFSFCLILMALRVFDHLRDLPNSNYLICCGAIAFLVSLLAMFDLPSLTEKILCVNLCFILTLAIAVLCMQRFSGKWCLVIGAFLLVFCFFEILTGTDEYFRRIDKDQAFADRLIFARDRMSSQKALNLIGEQDDSFYRVEKIHPRNSNDNMVDGYNSVANFSSANNHGLNTLLQSMGFFTHCQEFELVFTDGATPVSESFLGVKYLLAQSTDERDYPVLSTEPSVVFQNPNAQPLMFGASASVLDWMPDITEDYDPFEVLETIYAEMTGTERDFFVSPAQPQFELQNLTVDSDEYFNWFYQVDQTKTAEITWQLTADQNANYYAYFPAREIGKLAEVYINGELQTERYFREPRPYILNLSNMQAGETVKVQIKLDSYDLCLFAQPYFYRLDETAFSEAAVEAQQYPFDLEQITDTNIRGTITGDDGQILMTTIPFDKGWRVKVNGQEAQIRKALGAFIAIPLLSGTNSLELEYSVPGLAYGVIVSIGSLLIMLVSLLFTHKADQNRTQENAG